MALNTHGTRAVQKLIETLTTREQVIPLHLCCSYLIPCALPPGVHCAKRAASGSSACICWWDTFCPRHVVPLMRATGEEPERAPGCAQVSLVTDALEEGVVSLIRDLNGNHVIQRCLQRLGPEESQFVYEAAAANTMDIATHRHGCCVLQRCIDFATPAQKRRVVDKISDHALPLSQVGSHRRPASSSMPAILTTPPRRGLELSKTR